jgi:hypothetical protein
MLDALVQTADARSSRWTMTFGQTDGQSCVRSGVWRAAGEPALENVLDDGDLALDGQRGIRVGLQALGRPR